MGLNAADEIQGQQVWDDLPLGSGLAGGGGQSAVFGRPWYQQHLTTAGHGRLVPDMALEADTDYPIANYCTTGCNGYGWAGGGGTSAATPLMAGGIALADEQASATGKARLVWSTRSCTSSGKPTLRPWSTSPWATMTSTASGAAPPSPVITTPPAGGR